MGALRNKIAAAINYPNMVIDEIMRIIESHIEWTDPNDCPYGYTYSHCGWYEICDEFVLQTENGYYIGQFSTLDEAKEAAQKHKDIYGG